VCVWCCCCCCLVFWLLFLLLLVVVVVVVVVLLLLFFCFCLFVFFFLGGYLNYACDSVSVSETCTIAGETMYVFAYFVISSFISCERLDKQTFS